jgi:hypothetical protein
VQGVGQGEREGGPGRTDPPRTCASREPTLPLGKSEGSRGRPADEGARRVGARSCLRRGCEEPFTPARWAERFCGDAECSKEIERWLQARGGWPPQLLPPAGEVSNQENTALPAAVGRRHFGTGWCAKQCGRSFEKRSPNQLYCDSCRDDVRRKQARRRQEKRREGEKGHRRHAKVERRRRKKRRAPRQAEQVRRPEKDGAARGHASGEALQSGRVCQRPGCFAPVRDSPRRSPSYCGPACALAVRRVLDRERKWRRRGTSIGRLARRLAKRTASEMREEKRVRRQEPGDCHVSPGGQRAPPT